MSAPFRMSELITFAHPSDGRTYVIQPTTDGDLRCATCDKDWCEHVQGCLMMNQDADQVWMRIERYESRGAGATITIPLRPGDDIRVMVLVERLAHNPDAAKVTWWSGNVGMGPPHSLTPFMGFLNRGEGRLQLRQMVVNWFEPMMEVEQHHCSSSHHNWRVDGQIAADKNDRVKLFVHCWRLVFSRMCNICYNLPTGFDPDLIPGA